MNRILLLFPRKRKAKKLRAYLVNLDAPNFSDAYRAANKAGIQALEWLLAYYEGWTGCSPKEYLQALLQLPYFHPDNYRLIQVLYHWIYNHNEIYGF